MKVRELIEELEDLPSDAEVYYVGDEGDEWPVAYVVLNSEGVVLY